VQAEAVPAPPGWLRVVPLVLVARSLIRAARGVTPGARLAAVVGAMWLATALFPMSAAYDWPAAVSKFWLLVGALGVAAAVARLPSTHVLSGLALLAASAAGLSLYFVATNAWWAAPVKLPALAALGQALARGLPSLPGPRIHPNVIGGVVASLLPFVVPSLVLTRGFWMRTTSVALGAAAGCGLLLTSSRGAWVVAGIVGTVWAAARIPVWSSASAGDPLRQSGARRWLVGAAIAAAFLGVAALVFWTQLLTEAVGVHGRLSVQAHAAELARDYMFTGAGLGAFPMQFAVYAEVISVRSAAHAHNLFLDLVIEQGAGGLAAYLLLVALTIRAAWRGRQATVLAVRVAAEAALASQAVILLYGLLDDTLYSSRGVIVLFVPLGVALAVAGLAPPETDARRWRPRRGAVIAIGALVLAAAAAVARPAGAAWQANMGALAQSDAELTVYDQAHFDRLTLDQVRRQIDLDSAIARFQGAQRIDPSNPTASRRLAMILIARGAYVEALRQIESSWDAGHRDGTTRALFGDALVANGRVGDAVRLLTGEPLAADRLKSQAWYRYWTGGDFVRAFDAWTAASSLDPADAEARAWAARARARIGRIN
jgi:tetratricopeptide (TPR) repeat protein